MNQRLVQACVASVALHSAYAFAAPLFFSGLPGVYTPGSPIEFDVGLPPVANLGAFNIDVVLTGTSGVAGVDYFFDVAATLPSSPNYVFPSAVNFFDAVNVDSLSQHRITLTDFDVGGVNVVSSINDLVAMLVIQTSGGFSGDLSVAFDLDGLILDTPDLTPTPVAGFDAIASDTAAAGSTVIRPVPEPTAMLLVLVSLAMAGMRHRIAALRCEPT